jgi:methylglyoxal synthase
MAIDLPASAGRRIALIAHDNKKQDMLEWAKYNLTLLTGHELFATATTGRLLHEQLGLPVTCFRSGPFGGDQQIGARIAEGGIDLLVFFWDPLEPHPHDPDVKALLRVAVVCNIPIACNRATADFLISSPLMDRVHQPWDPAAADPGQREHAPTGSGTITRVACPDTWPSGSTQTARHQSFATPILRTSSPPDGDNKRPTTDHKAW